jgi:AMP-polyphosphate phosphotransferase
MSEVYGGFTRLSQPRCDFAQVREREARAAWDDAPPMGRLDDLDLTLKLSKEEEAERLAIGGERLAHLRLALGGMIPYTDGVRRLGPPVCLVFEGWDASGKGGAIKRLVAHLDPRHVRYAAFAAPTADEKRHHYLHRFAAALPGWGGMAIVDRSWYGRVLVERVEGFATVEQWSRAYDEINGFERTLAADGMIFAKFWLHVSDSEQLKRFRKRERDPLKSYKLTDEDWRNRARRDDYAAAIEEMVDRTDTEWAPWTLVEGDSKRWARVKVLETTIATIEAGMRRQGFEPLDES